MIVGQARHSGAGSGCQGCDPEVPVPLLETRVFLCQPCLDWMLARYGGEASHPSQVVERRKVIGVSLTPVRTQTPEPIEA